MPPTSARSCSTVARLSTAGAEFLSSRVRLPRADRDAESLYWQSEHLFAVKYRAFEPRRQAAA